MSDYTERRTKIPLFSPITTSLPLEGSTTSESTFLMEIPSVSLVLLAVSGILNEISQIEENSLSSVSVYVYIRMRTCLSLYQPV